MSHTTGATRLMAELARMENELLELGYTIKTSDNPALPNSVEDAKTAQITNAAQRRQADLGKPNGNSAHARVFISGWGEADGMVLVKTRAGTDRFPTDDTPAEILSMATQAAVTVWLDNTGHTVIEIHPGDDGRYYLHDPLDPLRFGPTDSYASREGARLAAAVTDHDALIVDR